MSLICDIYLIYYRHFLIFFIFYHELLTAHEIMISVQLDYLRCGLSVTLILAVNF
jgi:hypothetical protein